MILGPITDRRRGKILELYDQLLKGFGQSRYFERVITVWLYAGRCRHDAASQLPNQGFRRQHGERQRASQIAAGGEGLAPVRGGRRDDDGQVDVTRQAPVSGTYEGVASMGLFWSMDRLPSEARPAPPGAIMLPVPIRLEAEGTDGRRAEITIVRRVAGLGVTRHVIRTDGLVGTLFLPPGPGPHPAVMVVSGGGGGIDEFRGAILASHGYAALALGHFAVDGRPRGLVNIPLEYFETALGWMRAEPWFDRRLLAVWGASRGGEQS